MLQSTRGSEDISQLQTFFEQLKNLTSEDKNFAPAKEQDADEKTTANETSEQAAKDNESTTAATERAAKRKATTVANEKSSTEGTSNTRSAKNYKYNKKEWYRTKKETRVNR